MQFRREDLEPAEQELAAALETGTVYGPETEDRDTWPVIRADTIRNLLRGVYEDLVPDPKGLRLRHVFIYGRIDLDHLETRTPLELDQCDLPEGLTAVHAQLPVLRLHRMKIDRPSTEEAVVYLEDLHLAELSFKGTTLINRQGPALQADGLTVDSGTNLDEGFTATGHGELGAVRLIAAAVGGQLVLRGATLTNNAGPALQADRITAEAGAWLDAGFTAVGHGPRGAVRLTRATIGGQLRLRGATLTNEAGPALDADWITVASNVFLGGVFSASDFGPDGAVRMSGATIRGRLVLSDARFPEAPEENCAPTVVLTGTDVGAELVIDSATLERESTSGRWNIDGLTYRKLSGSSDQWLEFLRVGTRQYSTQPYQQFAAVARARGDEQLTRKILIAQHNDLLARSRHQHGLLTARQRAALRLLKVTVGYGYRTWLAVLWLGLVVALAVVASFAFGSPAWSWLWAWSPDLTAAALEQPEGSEAGTPCRNVDMVVLGLETIPLIPLVSGAKDTCAVTNTAAGIAFLGVSMVLKIVAWALVTLFVAGYTNIVRKPAP